MPVQSTSFPINPRIRGNPQEAISTVWQMLQFLRDVVDRLANKFAQGSATISAGTFSVVVPLGQTIATYQVEAIPTQDPGSRFWVSAKTATQFQINLSSAAPAGGVAFDWIAKGV